MDIAEARAPMTWSAAKGLRATPHGLGERLVRRCRESETMRREQKIVAVGAASGIAVMAASLWILNLTAESSTPPRSRHCP